MSVCIADLLVSNSIRRASTFERDRVRNMHDVYRRAFSFPASRYKLAKCHIRFCLHLSAGAGFRQETPDSLCSVCPPASKRLKISFQLDIDRFVFPGPCS